MSVRLVGSHPLWGHYLYVCIHAKLELFALHFPVSFFLILFFDDRWNAARALARFLQRNPELYAGKNVLELGAGGGLPGLIAAKCGAQKVRASCQTF